MFYILCLNVLSRGLRKHTDPKQTCNPRLRCCMPVLNHGLPEHNCCFTVKRYSREVQKFYSKRGYAWFWFWTRIRLYIKKTVDLDWLILLVHEANRLNACFPPPPHPRCECCTCWLATLRDEVDYFPPSNPPHLPRSAIPIFGCQYEKR
jgi:hypothetical protein